MTTQPDVASARNFPAATEQEWMAAVEKVLKGKSFEQVLVSTTYDGIAVQPLYREDSIPAGSDLPGDEQSRDRPSVAPAATTGWSITSQPFHPDPAQANHEILSDLEGGAEGVHLALDVGGRGDVDGVIVSSTDDLQKVLDGVLMDLVPICLSAGSDFSEAANMLREFWRASPVESAELSGTFGADPISALLRTGRLLQGWDGALAQLAELAEITETEFDAVTAVDISSLVVSDAGGSDAQELAYLLCCSAVYLAAMLDRGMTLSAAATQISWTTTSSPDVFATVSKFRAARRLWAHFISVAGLGTDLLPLRLSAVSAQRGITQRDPWVNMLRGTASCFAAAVGGAEAISVAPFDSSLGISTSHGRRVARNTQLLLREESHLAKVIDPAAGSFYVETFTSELVGTAWDLFVEIEGAGGMRTAVESGTLASQIEAVRSVREHNIDRRKDPLTGVSEFPNLYEDEPETVEVDRDQLRAEARGGSAPTPSADSAAATVVDKLVGHPLAARFEALRDRSDQYLAEHGARPSAFLANLGPVAVHTARATYATNLLQAGGFEVLVNDGFATPSEAASAFGSSGADLAAICSSDDLYAELGEAVAAELKAKGARSVILAGRVLDDQALRAAGVDDFVHMGCNVMDVLTALWDTTSAAQNGAKNTTDEDES